jgi:diacylglycerol kinase family enzyme
MSTTRTTCVIFNPAAGRGHARRLVQRWRRGDPSIRLCPTEYAGQAEELAYRAACEGAVKVIAAGGDGTVHEVANGLIRSQSSDVVLRVWPCGSANDYAFALNLTGEIEQPTEVIEVDVGQIRSSEGRERHFINGMGLGFNGAVTWESRRIRWLRGVPLYAAALFRAMIASFDKPRMRIQFDDLRRETPTLALSLGIGQREGNFPLLPAADLCDGWFDYLHAGPVSRWELIRHFPGLLQGTLPTDHPRLWLGRCRRLFVESEQPLRIHIDGEFFSQPDDGVFSVSVTLLPRRLRVERGIGPTSHNRCRI